MRKTFAIVLCAFCVQLSLVLPTQAKKLPAKKYHFKEQAQPAPPPADLGGAPLRSSAAADTFNLGWFSFSVAGSSDPQGWTTVDLTAQLTFWHAASGGGELTGGTFGNLLPLQGNNSMWCGQAPSTSTAFCGWAALPGYGNGWDQILVSATLPGDSVRISYKVFWDSEPGYDGTTVEYSGDGGLSWTQWPVGVGFTARPNVYDGGPQTLVESFNAGGLTTVQLRYRFDADGAWSDEDGLWPTDGAVLLDSITVTTWAGGIQASTNFEDFEGAAEGDTSAGIWSAIPAPSYGNFAALYPGVAILQDDPCFTNFTHLWGWFADPTVSNYNCHVPDPRPDVGAMPFGNAEGLYLANEIWSPILANVGAGNEYIFQFLTYRDLPLDNLQFYTWGVRSIDATGCPGTWGDHSFVHFGGQKDWIRTSFSVGTLLNPAWPEIQLRIGARDMCLIWCNIFGTGTCHSHAPLVDEVHLKRVNVIGPRFAIRHLDLFQDNFSADGTITGTAGANSANDIAATASPTILRGDSVTLDITNLVGDPLSGIGPAAYCYVAVWPQGQPGKGGVNIEAPETLVDRFSGSTGGSKRWPLVASPMLGGVQWYQFRMDSAFTAAGAALADRFSIDLNDNLFTPGDTIGYFFGAQSASSSGYFHRILNGQGANNITADINEAANSPMEFTILPAGGFLRGGDILYVDDTDDRGGPAQLFFDTAFDYNALAGEVDRYDVLGPSSGVSNSLGATVTNVFTQIIGPYKTIIWNSGNLSSTLMNDVGVFAGGGSADKSPDFSLIFTFLDQHPNNPGVYYSADDGPSDWALVLTGVAAVNTRSIYMNFNLDPATPAGDHKNAGEPISPVLDGVDVWNAGEQLVAYGGCPLINDFDLLQATGLSVAAYNNTGSGKTYVLSQTTPNSAASTARFVLSGFSYHNIRDVGPPGSFPVRVKHLRNIVGNFFQTPLPVVSGFGGAPQYVNVLEPNYPNPFNPTTHITFEIKKRGHVTLRIYNVAGQVVRTLVNEELAAGRYESRPFNVWDGTNDAGQEIGSGVYFYKLTATNFTQTRKLVLLK